QREGEASAPSLEDEVVPGVIPLVGVPSREEEDTLGMNPTVTLPGVLQREANALGPVRDDASLGYLDAVPAAPDEQFRVAHGLACVDRLPRDQAGPPLDLLVGARQAYG